MWHHVCISKASSSLLWYRLLRYVCHRRCCKMNRVFGWNDVSRLGRRPVLIIFMLYMFNPESFIFCSHFLNGCRWPCSALGGEMILHCQAACRLLVCWCVCVATRNVICGIDPNSCRFIYRAPIIDVHRFSGQDEVWSPNTWMLKVQNRCWEGGESYTPPPPFSFCPLRVRNSPCAILKFFFFLDPSLSWDTWLKFWTHHLSLS